MSHALGAVPLLDKIFSVGPFPISGDGDTVALAGKNMVCLSLLSHLTTGTASEEPFNLQGWATHFR